VTTEKIPPLASPPAPGELASTLEELAALSRSTGRFEWTPANDDLSPPRLKLFTVLLIIGVIAAGSTSSIPQNETHRSGPVESRKAYPIGSVLSQGQQFYLVKQTVTPEDLKHIDLARKRGAKVTVLFENGNVPDGYRVPDGLILESGVLVNGARWLPIAE
jgi:hypothetical protein